MTPFMTHPPERGGPLLPDDHRVSYIPDILDGQRRIWTQNSENHNAGRLWERPVSYQHSENIQQNTQHAVHGQSSCHLCPIVTAIQADPVPSAFNAKPEEGSTD